MLFRFLPTMKAKKIIKLFEDIRDLPYGTSGDASVYSCYQKATLLAKELQNMGITTQLLIGEFDWANTPIPQHILQLRRLCYQRHVILRVHLGDSFCDIDPSVDAGLAHILPMPQWDGSKNTTTLAPMQNIRPYYPYSLHERIMSRLKRLFLRSNPDEFYTKLDTWLASRRHTTH